MVIRSGPCRKQRPDFLYMLTRVEKVIALYLRRRVRVCGFDFVPKGKDKER